MSFGALIQTVRQAASAIGYRVDLQVLARGARAVDIAQGDLTATAAADWSTAPALIHSRATPRTPFRTVELAASDVDQLLGLGPSALVFVPRQSSAGRWLADAFAQQTWDDRRQSELAEWLRFSRREVRARGDGLTPGAGLAAGCAGGPGLRHSRDLSFGTVMTG